MTFVQICMFAIIGVFLSLFLKNMKPEYSLCISLCVVTIIMLLSSKQLSYILNWIEESIRICSDFIPFFKVLVKMIGISFTSEITVGICKDAGMTAMGEGVEILTRILLCMLSLPILKEVLSLLNSYL